VLAATVTTAARRFGDRTCLVAPSGWELSYRALDRASDEAAVALSRRGLGEGGVLAVVLPPCPEYTVLYAAAAKLGAATAGVNHRLTGPEREAVLGTAGADLVVGTTELLPDAVRAPVVTVEPVRRDGGGDGPDVLSGLREPGGTPPPLADDAERTVAIVFTSGTTGAPKGAVFAGRQLDFICGVDTGRLWADPAAPPAHALSGTSATHLGPMTKLAGNLHRGGTTHLVDRWRADDALRATAEHRMPAVAGIPTQIALMLRRPLLDELDLSCVRAVVVGGGPAAPALVREARERFGAPVAVRYACTEAGIGVGTALDDPPEDAEETVGRAHAGVELTIRDAEGRWLPAGETGEVCLRSPAVMSGYHRDPAATTAAFWPDGAARTGDLGFVDERGRLHLVGRSKEMFVRGGYNVYPMEVEAVLSTHPGIAEVCVVPRTDPVMGEVGVAVVVVRAGSPTPGLEELRSFAAPRLARHKLPEDLVVLDTLPLTPMDKVDRRAVAELASER
jgi:acyl-CoA synthetase (AMP-forming)/AMP-acid ligase II